MQWLPQRLHLPALSRGVKDSKDMETPEPSGGQGDDDAASLLQSEVVMSNEAVEVVKITGGHVTARDHLANERLFLAWLRTALSSVALGLALAKFTVGVTSIVGGTLFIAMGMIILAYSAHRYYSVEDGLRRGDYVLPRNGINLMLLLACVGTVAALAFVLFTPSWSSPSWSSPSLDGGIGTAEPSSTGFVADNAEGKSAR